MCPLRNIVGVAFDYSAIGKTKEDASLMTVDRVVVDIDPVGNAGSHLAIDDGFLLAGDNLYDRNIMSALQDRTMSMVVHSMAILRCIMALISAK